jgi:hypothetical protein
MLFIANGETGREILEILLSYHFPLVHTIFHFASKPYKRNMLL